MRRIAWGVAAFALIAAGTAWSQAKKEGEHPQPPKHEQFEKIKSLAGEWTGKEDMEGKTHTVTFIYRVTAGGSAVVETLFPGEPHEMVTVYTVDKGALVLTHYCAMGNQPRMQADPQKDAKVIEFTCDGKPGNVTSDSDPHMHTGRIAWTDDDHIQAAWTAYKDGKPTEQAKFDLTRKQ